MYFFLGLAMVIFDSFRVALRGNIDMGSEKLHF